MKNEPSAALQDKMKERDTEERNTQDVCLAKKTILHSIIHYRSSFMDLWILITKMQLFI